MREASSPATMVVIGASQHGVVRHARASAAAAGVPTARFDSVADFVGSGASFPGVVHTHFTDRLFGTNVASAACGFDRLADAVHGPLVVSLHDVPVEDSTAYTAGRIDLYRSVIAAADAVIVCSSSERARVAALGTSCPVHVVPLAVRPQRCGEPVRPTCAAARTAARSATIGVLGFVYPGKGHADVIESAAAVRPQQTVVALGRCSDGHEWLGSDLGRRAAELDVDFRITGFLTDGDLRAESRRISVPIVPATQTSASASLATWIEFGRRPLVAANAYAVEFAAEAPGMLSLYDPSDPAVLRDALSHAIADPESTWSDRPVPDALGVAAVSRRLLGVHRSVAS